MPPAHGPGPDPAPEPVSRWVTGEEDGALWLKATAVAVNAAGILILGASGSGKSSLALALMAHGATLVSDDAVRLRPLPGGALLERPDTSPDLIEARGVGLLQGGPVTRSVALAIAVDLDRPETARLPPRRVLGIGDWTYPLILGGQAPSLAASLVIMARHGRAAP
ncbi:HPr kinase/phosphorylase [Roseicyclus amphidinii]|uniref:HPr kinase/phosphorylase n=1 Tax=Roseicyclus amphidinii TaxID=3034232 RepID=UPI0024E0F02E|nr:serine kinase [Roseicyclus sp. Amp-Y-6]